MSYFHLLLFSVIFKCFLKFMNVLLQVFPFSKGATQP